MAVVAATTTTPVSPEKQKSPAAKKNVKSNSTGNLPTYVRSPEATSTVSRQSGLTMHTGTFGKTSRFQGTRSYGEHSPWGDSYFSKAAFWRGPHEQGKASSLGVGSRPPYVRGLPNVGPGTYSPVTSVAKPASSLDGKKYCKATMKSRTKVVVGAVSPHEEALKPGPGTYTLPDDINGHYIMRGTKAEWAGPPGRRVGWGFAEKFSVIRLCIKVVIMENQDPGQFFRGRWGQCREKKATTSGGRGGRNSTKISRPRISMFSASGCSLPDRNRGKESNFAKNFVLTNFSAAGRTTSGVTTADSSSPPSSPVLSSLPPFPGTLP